MLYVFGVGEIPISISSDPAHTRSLAHTVRAVGTATTALVKLKHGSVVGVRGPFGSQWPVEEAKGKDLLIVAGGIGMAPLRPVLYSVLAQRNQYRRLLLLYGARTPKDLLYQRELARWQKLPEVQVQVTVDNADRNWRGHVGVVTKLMPKTSLDPASTLAMICGPEIMMRFTLTELRKLGLEPEQIFLSLERNMKCAVGFCGHCQFGPHFICKEGPVFRLDRVTDWFGKREI